MNARELALTAKFIEAVPGLFPCARAFRRNILNVTARDDRTGRTFRARAGISGQADVYVYVRGGQVIECELKSESGRMRPGQLEWREFCRNWDIPHVVLQARPGLDDEKVLLEWLEALGRKLSHLASPGHATLVVR